MKKKSAKQRFRAAWADAGPVPRDEAANYLRVPVEALPAGPLTLTDLDRAKRDRPEWYATARRASRAAAREAKRAREQAQIMCEAEESEVARPDLMELLSERRKRGEVRVRARFPRLAPHALLRAASEHAFAVSFAYGRLPGAGDPTREAVNYLRHEWTDYDADQSRDRHRDACLLIAEAYPYLAAECTRQIARREAEPEYPTL